MFKLGDHIVNSISGPISIYILEPTDKFRKEYSSGRAPVMMLFGDEHHSFSGVCKKCDCETCNGSNCKGKCCLELYSHEMFEILNSLSTKTNPIDFYIEHFIRKEEVQEFENHHDKYALVNQTRRDFQDVYKSGKVGSLGKVLIDNLPCFIKDYRRYSDFAKQCKFDKMRWHYSDVRIITYKSNYDLEAKLHEMCYLLTDSINDWIQGGVLEINVDNILEDFIDEEHKREFLEIACEMFNTPDKFIKRFLDSKLLHRSLVFKQINKLPQGYNNIEMWKKWIYQYYTAVVLNAKEISIYMNKKMLGSNMYSYIKTLLLGKHSDSKKINSVGSKRQHTVWDDYLKTLTTAFLDIYYVARSLKTPKNDVNPFLSIGYFGDFHCENLVKFLTDITGWYMLSSSHSTNNRCLTTTNVNFDFFALKKKYGLPETNSKHSTSSSSLHSFNGLVSNVSQSITNGFHKYLDSQSVNSIKSAVTVNLIQSLKHDHEDPMTVTDQKNIFEPVINHRIKTIFSKQR